MTRVHRLAAQAVKDGVLVAPDNCERCQDSEKELIKHHKDYSKPLDVTWLCRQCHTLEHLENPHIKNPDKQWQIYVSDETKDLLERISKADERTQDGEIRHLLNKRDRELDILEAAKNLP